MGFPRALAGTRGSQLPALSCERDGLGSSGCLLRFTTRDTKAEDSTLFRLAATVVRQHQLPGGYNVPGWESVAKALDRMARLPTDGSTDDHWQDQLDAAFVAVREHPGETAAEIGGRIGVDREAALRLLGELERRGLVTRATGQAETRWSPS